MNEIRVSKPAPVREFIDLMDLTSRAADLFRVQLPQEKQRFLRLALKSPSSGRLQTEFDQPFESLRRSNQLSKRKQRREEMPTTDSEIWLPRKTRRTRLRRIITASIYRRGKAVRMRAYGEPPL